ncbi:hypothetical protein [uncultured Psychrobacter sp.]|uniref:hypothetical protein n=1 Tax=uncultured Psychrobacter sp. TaxID=259303 RepID=UPI0025936E10|nr:hypothetical protein [uncultured Psychrobacter sp.]
MLSPKTMQRRHDRNFERTQNQFDALSPQEAVDKLNADPISERMALVATSQMRIQALSVAFSLAAMLNDTEYDSDALLPSELLDSLMLEAFADDDDEEYDGGDVDDKVKTVFSAHVADALSTLGVEDAVIEDLFDSDVEVADAAVTLAAETVLENMPDDGDDLEEFAAAFAYGDEDDNEGEGEVFDSMNNDTEYMFDAAAKRRVGKKTVKKVNGKTLVYKAVKAIRNGKRVVINKRISGKPFLKAGQKAALKKARRKASTGTAIRKQMRSLGKGIRANIYKGNTKGLQAAALKRHSKSLGI